MDQMFETSQKEEDMFHHDWIVSRLAEEQRRDALRQAEQSRKAKHAKPPQAAHQHAFYHALDWTGRRLVKVGEQLQEQHAARHYSSLIHISRG